VLPTAVFLVLFLLPIDSSLEISSPIHPSTVVPFHRFQDPFTTWKLIDTTPFDVVFKSQCFHCPLLQSLVDTERRVLCLSISSVLSPLFFFSVIKQPLFFV